MRARSMIYLMLVISSIFISSQLFAAQVKISYAPSIERYLSSINANESAREGRFRETLSGNQRRLNSLIRFNKARLEGTDWAGQRLIESADDYTLDRLLRSLIDDNLNRFSSNEHIQRIEVNIDSIRVSNYALPRISSAGTYVKGEISWYNAEGELAGETDLTANLVPIPVLSRAYKGEKYAYGETDENNRVGPVITYFVEQALKDLFPIESEQIHGPVLVKFASGVGARVAGR